jgi:hypothetical protein
VHLSKVAPPGARAPLVVLVVALAAGAVMFLGVHLHRAAAAPARPSPPLAAGTSTAPTQYRGMP